MHLLAIALGLSLVGSCGGLLVASSLLLFNPARDRAIVVLYNCMDMTPGKLQLTDRVAANVTALLDGKPAPPLTN